MLRLTLTDTPHGSLLRLEGRLTGCWADQLRDLCPTDATVDLEWVTFVDDRGAEVLTDLARRGVHLVRLPLFVSSLLEGGSR